MSDIDVMTKETKTEKNGKGIDLSKSRKAQVAEKLGIEEDKIKTVAMQLDKLRSEGLLIDIEVSGTSMFVRGTNWFELGISDTEDARRKRLTKGSKFLIPEKDVKAIKSVETSMRSLLNRYSFSITGFKPYRWLPYTAYQEWKTRWQEQLDRFEEAKQNILNNYDQYIEILQKDFAEVGEAAWNSFTNQGYNWVIIDQRPYSKEEFISLVVNDAMDKLPTRTQIQENLKADYITALVYGMEDIARDQANAQNVRLTSEAEREKVREEARKARIEADTLAERARHEGWLHQHEQDRKLVELEAMFAAEIEHARKQLEGIGSPFDEVIISIRNQFAEDAASMLESIQKNGFIKGKIAEKGRGLLELFSLLSTTDDKALREKLIALKQAIGPIADERTDTTPERSTEEVKNILEEIKRLAKDEAGKLKSAPSRFSFVE